MSGVELLMNNHQSLKAEIDAREENFNVCIKLGRELLNRKHYASSEVEKKLIKLTTERADMMRRWEDRWEYLQLSRFLQKKKKRRDCTYHLFSFSQRGVLKRFFTFIASAILSLNDFQFVLCHSVWSSVQHSIFSFGSVPVCQRCSCGGKLADGARTVPPS